MTFNKTFKDLIVICFATFFITFLIWLPHILAFNNFYGLNFSQGFNTIYRNFDGLEYVVIAKSFYNKQLIINTPQELPHTYYASHFPLYSVLILLFSPILGFIKSMLFVSVLSTILACTAFYFLVRNFQLSENPLLLSLIFLVLPARWLIVHSVGSSEPTFILFIILALYFFMKYEHQQKWLDIHLSSLFGLLAQLTRPPGILLFIALSLYIIWKEFLFKKTVILANPAEPERPESFFKTIFRYHPLILIPIGLVGIFYLFQINYNDFWAYFHSGDNIHLTFLPFQVFNVNQFWVGDIWLEDVIYIFILGLLGGLLLLKQKLYPLAFFVLTYFTATIMVAHRDISRYFLPTFPFLLIAFEKVLTSKEFKIVLLLLLIAFYFYAQNFILQNVSPVPNPRIYD